MNQLDFWVPSTKRELVDWLTRHCGNKMWRKFPKRTLYAIYFKQRKSILRAAL